MVKQPPLTIYRRDAVDRVTMALVEKMGIPRPSIRKRVDQAFRAAQNQNDNSLPKTNLLPAGDVLLLALTNWPACQDQIRKQFPGISPSSRYLSAQVNIEAAIQVMISGVVEPGDDVELRRRFRTEQLEMDALRRENALLKFKADRLDARDRANRANGSIVKSPPQKS